MMSSSFVCMCVCVKSEREQITEREITVISADFDVPHKRVVAFRVITKLKFNVFRRLLMLDKQHAGLVSFFLQHQVFFRGRVILRVGGKRG